MESRPQGSFNLVIERLFISGRLCYATQLMSHKFQSRYRAAFHFRDLDPPVPTAIESFNLVIERLFISVESLRRGSESHPRFNLVIERLFISVPGK